MKMFLEFKYKTDFHSLLCFTHKFYMQILYLKNTSGIYPFLFIIGDNCF